MRICISQQAVILTGPLSLLHFPIIIIVITTTTATTTTTTTTTTTATSHSHVFPTFS
jgi:hypothetical protein